MLFQTESGARVFWSVPPSLPPDEFEHATPAADVVMRPVGRCTRFLPSRRVRTEIEEHATMFDHNPWNNLAVIHAVNLFDDRGGAVRERDMIDGLHVRASRRGIFARLVGWLTNERVVSDAASTAAATASAAEVAPARKHRSRPKLMPAADGKASYAPKSDSSRAA